MAVFLSPVGGVAAQFFTNTGVVLTGGKLYTYAAGTTTPQATYTTSSGNTSRANPIVLDSAGRVPDGGEIWLTGNVFYKFVLKDSSDTLIATYDNVGGITDSSSLLAYEASIASSTGSSLVGFIQSGGNAITVQSKLRQTISVKDFGAKGDGTTDDTAAIAAAETACFASGQSLYFPAGTYKCLTGLTKKAVNWHGDGKYKSILSYYGTGTFINATGTTSSRVICTISDMGFDGTNANANAVGFTFGWNQRSTPLVRVYISNFGYYGIYFNDQNWIVDFYDVQIDTCGKRTTNGCGIYKNTLVDSGTWNSISFYSLTVEACGRSDSAAGAINLPTTSANRGLYFYSPCIEGNFGTSEIIVTNMADCQFYNLYMEVISAQAINAVELYGVTGGFTGGYITGDNIVNNLCGIKIRAGGAYVSNEIELDKITILNFAASVNAEVAKVWTNQIHGDRVFTDPSTNTQFFGDYSPRVSAVKNATQTITSGSFQKVTFQTEIYDLCGKFASSTWAPETIGTYQIDAGIRFTTGVDQTRIVIAIYVRGSAVKTVAFNCSGTGEQTISISAQVDTQIITDTIEIYVRQDSGSDKIISSASSETWFMGSLIGRVS